MTTPQTLLTTFDTEWVGVIHEQAPKFVAGYADETIRNRMLLAYLRKHRRIVLGESSPVCIWNVKYDQQPVNDAGDGGTLFYNRHDLQQQAALNWRGYVSTDALTEKEFLMNKGPARILNRYGEIIPSLMEAVTDYFGGQLFVDGNATGNENKIHGIESFMTFATPGAADTIATPNDSYAGLNTNLGAISGTWSSNLATSPNATLANDFPNGSGDIAYDFYAPLGVHTDSTAWTGQTDWESNCERSIRQTIIWQTNRGGAKGRPTMLLQSADYHAGYLNHQEAKQRIIVPHRESEKLGFPEAVNQEGVSIYYDYEVPAETGYMFNINNMELCSLDNVLFGYRGPDFDMRSRSWLFYVGFWGNARYRPKHFAKLSPFTP